MVPNYLCAPFPHLMGVFVEQTLEWALWLCDHAEMKSQDGRSVSFVVFAHHYTMEGGDPLHRKVRLPCWVRCWAWETRTMRVYGGKVAHGARFLRCAPRRLSHYGCFSVTEGHAECGWAAHQPGHEDPRAHSGVVHGCQAKRHLPTTIPRVRTQPHCPLSPHHLLPPLFCTLNRIARSVLKQHFCVFPCCVSLLSLLTRGGLTDCMTQAYS